MNLAEATKEKTDLIPVTHFTVIRNKKNTRSSGDGWTSIWREV